MNWCFAIINKRIGEIYFEKAKNGQTKFLGHCYVKKEDFQIPEECRALEQDIKKVRITYRNGEYKLT